MSAIPPKNKYEVDSSQFENSANTLIKVMPFSEETPNTRTAFRRQSRIATIKGCERANLEVAL